MNKTVYISLLIIMLSSALISESFATPKKNNKVYIPITISTQAAKILSMYPDPYLTEQFPDTHSVDDWLALQKMLEIRNISNQESLIAQLEPTVTEINLAGVNALDIKPKNWQDNGKIMVYIHGGAYTLFSAKSTLGSSALMANVTGLRVISVDYTLAPHAKWQQTIEQVIVVFKALHKQGYDMENIAIYGDSAGGGLAAGSVLKMRDQGMGMPAVVVLWSPWSDITNTGDSYETLKHADPTYLYERVLKPSADAYADPQDQKHPYVSPVYGDYSKGFPPTLIQGGTKEIFLSNFIRHYQALDIAGNIVKLDIYEGMPHVFQTVMAGTPESDTALRKTNTFVKKYL